MNKNVGVITRKGRLIILSLGVITISILNLITINQESYSTHNCTVVPPSDRCHAVLIASDPAWVTTYGVKYTIKVVDMNSGGCSESDKRFVLVTTWVVFDNGDWVEWGLTSGWIWDSYLIRGGCYEERSYFAYRINGNYYEVASTDVDIGRTYTYEISGFKDRVWKYYINGIYAGSINLPHTYAIGFDAGAESNNDSIVLPTTHIYNGLAYLGNNQWNRWVPDRFVEENPLWVIDCTSGTYADHIHVGSSSYAKSCTGTHR